LRYFHLAIVAEAVRLQLAAARLCRLLGNELLPQRLVPFAARHLALALAVEARFVSIDC
jgi:hypothetical protein